MYIADHENTKFRYFFSIPITVFIFSLPKVLYSGDLFAGFRVYFNQAGTYTQYITMMLLWENTSFTMGEFCKKLFLNSGTLSPVLQRLEEKGFIERLHLEEDERYLVAITTDEGDALREKALKIPEEMAKQFNIEPEEAKELYRILYKILQNEENSAKGMN